MRFGDIRLFIILVWTVPLLVFFYMWAVHRKTTVMERFAQKKLLKEIVPSYGRDYRNLRIFLNIAAVFFIILALARPQWGFFWGDRGRRGVDVIFAVDVSKSMLAEDVSPNRLDFTKTELRDFVRKLKDDRVGIVGFSGNAFLQCPLTLDHNGFFLALNDLDIGSIPKGGTSLPEAIEEAIKAYKGAQTDTKILVIITDGENTEGDINKAIEDAKKDGIKIYTIGIGTKEGEAIPIMDENGNRTYLKDKSGNTVRAKLDETPLKLIAKETGGTYIKATQVEFGLRQIYDQELGSGEKKLTEDTKVKIYKERFQFPLALALILLMGEFALRGRSEKKKQ